MVKQKSLLWAALMASSCILYYADSSHGLTLKSGEVIGYDGKVYKGASPKIIENLKKKNQKENKKLGSLNGNLYFEYNDQLIFIPLDEIRYISKEQRSEVVKELILRQIKKQLFLEDLGDKFDSVKLSADKLATKVKAKRVKTLFKLKQKNVVLLNRKIDEIQDQLVDAESDQPKEDLIDQIELIEQALVDLARKASKNLEEELEALDEEISEIEEQLEGEIDDQLREELEDELDELEDELEELEDELEDAYDEIDEALEEELEALEDEISEIEEQLEGEIDDELREDLEDELEELEDELEELEDELEDAYDEIDEALEEELEALEEEISEIEEQLEGEIDDELREELEDELEELEDIKEELEEH